MTVSVFGAINQPARLGTCRGRHGEIEHALAQRLGTLEARIPPSSADGGVDGNGRGSG